MTVAATVAAVLVWAGSAVTAACCVGLLLRSGFYDRLHLLSGVSTVGAPMVVLGLAVGADDWHSAVKLLLVTVLILGTGPVIISATARARRRPQEQAP